MSSIQRVWVALVAVAIIAVLGLFTPIGKSVVSNFGGITNYDSLTLLPTTATEGLKVGTTTGIAVFNQITSGTCTLQNYAGSFTATTSLNHNCPATGVQAGDKVFVSLPINLALGVVTQAGNSIYVQGAAASTTAGNITVTLFNNTGTATTSYSQATTSVTWYAVRPI